MPGTSLNNIQYNNNDDTASAIEEALNETSELEQQPPIREMPQHQAPPQYQSPPPQQYQQPPPQQYQQPPQHEMPQYPPQYEMPPQQYGRENFEEPKSSGFSFTIPESLKKTLMLLVILFLLNNSSFKNVLTKIPFTINAEGEHTFMMTVIICLLIATVYFLASQVF